MLAFPFSLAHHFDITMQLGLVLLKRQNKVGSPHSQQLSNRFLTAYGIDRDKATRHLESGGAPGRPIFSSAG